ncbi:MAG TPA: ABC-type transport auxiliary lipoprotein family protein [Gammaproteobacteria bacterium]|nr:ABC-type transport auxiliary lipoprotein family protein [Gammaproteobacteria bacterium]
MAVTLGKLLRIILIPLLLGACSVLPEPKPAALDKYLLEYTPATVREPRADAPVLIVARPLANGAYDTARIAYMQQQFGLRYYTRSSWADTPARMLAPLLAEALNASGQFQAMYANPGRVAANLRLDTELLRFHQDFTRQPNEMHITVRAQLVDFDSQRVVATRLFDIREPASSEDTYGGVLAANRAVTRLLEELTAFCVGQSH